MTHYEQWLIEFIKNIPQAHYGDSKWWNEKALESAKEQLQLYKIGKGRLN